MIHGIVTTKLSRGTSLAERFMYKQSGSTEEDFLNFTYFAPHVNNKKVPRYPSLRAARQVRSQKKKKTNKIQPHLVTVGWARSFTYKLRQFTKCNQSQSLLSPHGSRNNKSPMFLPIWLFEERGDCSSFEEFLESPIAR